MPDESRSVRGDPVSVLRPHSVPGWWQVWGDSICLALLTPEDVAPIVARTTCYVADAEQSVRKITFANGCTVEVGSDGSLVVGWNAAEPCAR